MKKSEIFFRRQQVWDLYTQGYSKIKIAKKLKISSKTVSRDMQQIRKEAAYWVDELHRGEIQVQQKRSFDSIQRVSNELWNIYDDVKEENNKIKILNNIAQNSKLSLQMISNDIWEMRNSIYAERNQKSFSTFCWDAPKETDISGEQNVLY
jgi:predicted transcriptional regulator